MAKPLTLTDSTFADQVIAADVPVLVDFWAEWSATCKGLAPSINALAEEYEGRALIAKLDVEANPVTPARFGVTSVPQLLFFQNGQLVERINGYRPIEVLRAQLDALLAAALTP
jgi:thioredoxin 1